MTLESRLTALVQEIGYDIKAVYLAIAGKADISPSGVVTLDFGEGAMATSTVVTGVSTIASTSIVIPTLRIETTTEHSECDLLNDPIRLAVTSIVTGVGFTVVATMDNARANGTYKVNWLLIE